MQLSQYWRRDSRLLLNAIWGFFIFLFFSRRTDSMRRKINRQKIGIETVGARWRALHASGSCAGFIQGQCVGGRSGGSAGARGAAGVS